MSSWAGRGGGLYCSGASPTVQNSILWSNRLPEIETEGETDLSITYSDIKGGWPGEGNIDENPLFIGLYDYHLRPESPCVDAGTDGGVYRDIDGQTRPSGSGFDMGADEIRP